MKTLWALILLTIIIGAGFLYKKAKEPPPNQKKADIQSYDAVVSKTPFVVPFDYLIQQGVLSDPVIKEETEIAYAFKDQKEKVVWYKKTPVIPPHLPVATSSQAIPTFKITIVKDQNNKVLYEQWERIWP